MPKGTELPQLSFPRNPHYGTGVARRCITLTGGPGRVLGALADPFHEMTCELLHDGQRIVDVRGSMVRFPTTACPGASVQLRTLIGAHLPLCADEYYSRDAISRHCTHLFDLAYLCVAHAVRGTVTWRYEAIVPDAHGTVMSVAVRRNGIPVHTWQVQDSVVIAPQALSGLPLLKGFLAAASRQLTGDMLEAALVLARTYLISLGRPFDAEAWAGLPVRRNPALLDRCFAYAATRADTSVFMPGYVCEQMAKPESV